MQAKVAVTESKYRSCNFHSLFFVKRHVRSILRWLDRVYFNYGHEPLNYTSNTHQCLYFCALKTSLWVKFENGREGGTFFDDDGIGTFFLWWGGENHRNFFFDDGVGTFFLRTSCE